MPTDPGYCPDCGHTLPWWPLVTGVHEVGGSACVRRRNITTAIAEGLLRPRTHAVALAGITVQRWTGYGVGTTGLKTEDWVARWIATYDVYLLNELGIGHTKRRAWKLRMAARRHAESERVQAFLVLIGFRIDGERLP